MKRIIAVLAASVLVGTAFSSCSKKDDSSIISRVESSNAGGEAVINVPAKHKTTTESSEPVDITGIELGELRTAGSGDAFLAVVDQDWKVQFLGTDGEGSKSALSYNAGIASITGNGDYTVSVNADSNGFRYAMTGNPNTPYTPSGLKFLYVNIIDGENKFPGAVITVNSVRVDGRDIALSAKSYTSSEDNKDTRATLYNEYSTGPIKNSRSAEGALWNSDGSPADFASGYAAITVDPSEFSSWTSIEVDFTVSGIN